MPHKDPTKQAQSAREGMRKLRARKADAKLQAAADKVAGVLPDIPIPRGLKGKAPKLSDVNRCVVVLFERIAMAEIDELSRAKVGAQLLRLMAENTRELTDERNIDKLIALNKKLNGE